MKKKKLNFLIHFIFFIKVVLKLSKNDSLKNAIRVLVNKTQSLITQLVSSF